MLLVATIHHSKLAHQRVALWRQLYIRIHAHFGCFDPNPQQDIVAIFHQHLISVDMSETSSKKRRQHIAQESMSGATSKRKNRSSLGGSSFTGSDDVEENKTTRDRDGVLSSEEDLEIVVLENEVRELGAKVLAFRENGLGSFARCSEERVRAYTSHRSHQEATIDAAATDGKDGDDNLRQSLKERLAVANEALPALLKELVTWKTKIRQAVDVMKKGHQLSLLDEDDEPVEVAL